MNFIELLKVIFLGIVEGITEWLPVSSTGHLILADEFVKLSVTPAFKEMFDVVIQLGAIMAVVILYWKKLFPVTKKDNKLHIEKNTLIMWLKILIASIPAGIIGLKFDDFFNEHFYNPTSVSIALIVVGIAFILIEIYNKKKTPTINSIDDLGYTTALLIGVFQLLAAMFPGVSRSGSTIIGALLLGVSRSVAAVFTFFLAVPAMFGASLLKLVKFGFAFSGAEITALLTGMVVAFVVSVLSIKFLMGYIKKHDFKAFGIYRILLGIAVLVYFMFR